MPYGAHQGASRHLRVDVRLSGGGRRRQAGRVGGLGLCHTRSEGFEVLAQRDGVAVVVQGAVMIAGRRLQGQVASSPFQAHTINVPARGNRC